MKQISIELNIGHACALWQVLADLGIEEMTITQGGNSYKKSDDEVVRRLHVVTEFEVPDAMDDNFLFDLGRLVGNELSIKTRRHLLDCWATDFEFRENKNLWEVNFHGFAFEMPQVFNLTLDPKTEADLSFKQMIAELDGFLHRWLDLKPRVEREAAEVRFSDEVEILPS